MHKLVLVVVFIALVSLSTIIALAKSENSNSNSGKGQGLSSIKSSNHDPSTQAQFAAREATPSATCDPNANWKNHGEYVSCVAKLHLGGQTVSEAARSDIGKKHASGSASFSPSPSASATAAPVATSSASPEATSSAMVLTDIKNEAKQIMNIIISLLARLQELFSF